MSTLFTEANLAPLSDTQLGDLLQALLDTVDARRLEREKAAADTEVCAYCRAEPVDVSGLGAVTSNDDWTGIDGNGDPVCRDCWCAACTCGHVDVDERNRCEMGIGENDDSPCLGDPDRTYELMTGR